MAEIEVGRRLVQEKHLRLLRHCAREQHALPLAAREPVERPVLQPGDVEARHRRPGNGEVVRAREAECRKVRRAPHEHDLERGERELERRVLRHDRQPAGQLAAAVGAERGALEAHAPRARREDTREETHERRLPPPFGPITPTSSPGATARSTSLSTARGP